MVDVEQALTAKVSDEDGDSLTFQWSVTEGDEADVEFGTPTAKDTLVTFGEEDSYTLKLTVDDGNGGTDSDTVVFNVEEDEDDSPTAPTITSFTVNGEDETEVASGTEVTLAWAISGDVTEVTITPTVGDVTGDADKQAMVSPTATTTYTISAKNETASAEPKTVTVTIADEDDSPTAPTITSFTANGEDEGVEVASGTEVTLAWAISGDATEVIITPTVGNVTEDADKQAMVSPTTTTTYTINAKNGMASAEEQTVTITITDDDDGPTAPTITSFTANGEAEEAEVTSGTEITLAWAVSGDVTGVTISPDIGDVTEDTDNQVTVSPTVTTTYTINAKNGPTNAEERTVKVTITDDEDDTGEDSDLKADFEYTLSGTKVNFTSNTEGSNGNVLSYSWEFGDGGIGSGAKTSHTYAEAGTYKVFLTARTDDGATSRIDKDVTVTD